MNELEAVMRAERAWTDAHVNGDVETLARLMADDYLKIESDGSVSDRAATLAKYTPATRAWEKAIGDEYIVRVYGDTAIVIGRWTARGMNNGERFDYAARFLSVYVKRDGEWKMVAEQSTQIRV
jgi:ketosteroid isomerase-like protein